MTDDEYDTLKDKLNYLIRKADDIGQRIREIDAFLWRLANNKDASVYVSPKEGESPF